MDAHTPLEELAGLFTRDAVWEGKGAKYAKSFGGYRGREAIAAMFAGYMKSPAHFALNVHFLTSELIEVREDCAMGSWVMLQTSTFASGCPGRRALAHGAFPDGKSIRAPCTSLEQRRRPASA